MNFILFFYIQYCGDIMIIIDAGHGGFDPGGGTNDYFKEKDLTRKISDYQKRRFDELGIPAKRTRTFDETLNPNVRIDRIKELGAKESDILISNHINNAGDGGGEVIYSLKTGSALPSSIGNSLKKAGLPIRSVYQRIGKTGRDFYFILRDSIPSTSMIIEYGFANNDEDTMRLLEEWNVLAEAVVKSVAEYLGVNYTKPNYTFYKVKNGDSLYKIAEKFGVSVNYLKDLNSLPNDTIYENQNLLIYV